ncbi:hypothetical protein HPB48_015574 [Haemaphysalis longicornis]|uniref:Uncharacterized protein n=1 Tax=Haemaphysalis longicornis TaxID=44386 RepID=A0A9J6FJC7_HAELO|nr:hypothetical protein HPB48_015574 [Haemaphysalis longicornis]
MDHSIFLILLTSDTWKIDHVGKPSWQAQIRGKKLWTLKPVPECYATCHELRVVVQPGEIRESPPGHLRLFSPPSLGVAVSSAF